MYFGVQNGGLTAGDQLLSVDGQSLVGLTQERYVAMALQLWPSPQVVNREPHICLLKTGHVKGSVIISFNVFVLVYHCHASCALFLPSL